MEILIIGLIAYLVVSPDPISLAFSRGLFGAARGAATGRTPKSRKSSPRGRAMFAGWREGVAAARERREAGRDLWTRGSRVGGRVAGGTASLAHGIRDSIVARLARQAQDGAEAASNPDASPSSRGWAGPRTVGRPRTAPTSDAAGAVVDQDGNDVTPTAGEAAAAPRAAAETPMPDAAAPEATTPEKTPESEAASPEAAPEAATPEAATSEAATPEAAAEAPETSPAAATSDPTPQTPETATEPTPEPAPTGASTPNPHSTITTASNGAKPMSLGTTELSNIDDYEKELKAVEAAFGLVAEAMASIRTWAVNLPDRWSAANWGTAGLDRSVASIAESVGALRMPAVTETFSSAKAEVTKARGLGEAAASVQARGKTEAFRGQ
ncbi:hypothetical protein ABZS29_38575 [Kribbella sp. NPDC005582]|uniref:hypothetical protein n=1 Tax=Kribbella sp. NPDC005582 TaxID=3156893 RepID=UPI0033ADA1BC